jgi:hypothetical protein
MRTKGINIAIIIIISLVISGFSGFSSKQQPGQPPVTEYRLVIKQIDNVWRVVREDDETKSDVVVKRGDRIRWITEGSDASFQFTDERLVGHSTRIVRDGRPLVLAIGREAPEGIHNYAVFIHKDLTFAVGQSPPRIIVN